MKDRQSGVSPRRTVVKSLAVAFAATLTGAGAERVAALAPVPPSALKIGVLLPERTLYPRMAERYLGGLKLALTAPSLRETALVVRTTSGKPRDLEKAATALLDQGVQVLIALGDGTQAILGALAEERHVPLIVSELGGLMPRGERRSAFVFTNSLQLWQSEWALGAWSAHHLGRRVQVVASLLESGYDLPYAFSSGFSAVGGTVVGTTLADDFSGQLQTDHVLSQTRHLRPDHVHMISSGVASLAYLKAHQLSVAGQFTPVSTSGLAVAEPFRAGSTAMGRHSALSWASDLDTAQNRAFMAGYQRATGQAADAVAVLGHETGSWLLGALATVAGQTERTQAWLMALGTARFHSPRGEIVVDRQTQRAQAPIYLRRSSVLLGRPSHHVVSVLNAPPAAHPALQALTETPRSGWSALYLHA